MLGEQKRLNHIGDQIEVLHTVDNSYPGRLQCLKEEWETLRHHSFLFSYDQLCNVNINLIVNLCICMCQAFPRADAIKKCTKIEMWHVKVSIATWQG